MGARPTAGSGRREDARDAEGDRLQGGVTRLARAERRSIVTPGAERRAAPDVQEGARRPGYTASKEIRRTVIVAGFRSGVSPLLSSRRRTTIFLAVHPGTEPCLSTCLRLQHLADIATFRLDWECCHLADPAFTVPSDLPRAGPAMQPLAEASSISLLSISLRLQVLHP
jgi:hypothetical protein